MVLRKNKRGVMGLELMVVLTIVMLAVTIAIPLVLKKSSTQREDLTRKRIQAIKRAIVGDANNYIGKSRVSFGFVGDLGVLPGSLEELMINPAPTGGTYPAFQFSNNVWFGWRGPYLDSKPNQDDTDYVAFLDAWGQRIQYDENLVAGTARIYSNGAPDGGSVIEEFIVENETRTFIAGFFWDRLRNPLQESQVTVYFPDGLNGLTQNTITPTNPTTYDSQNDAVTVPGKRQIPVGVRYFETLDIDAKKIAALNGGDTSVVNFIGLQSAPEAPFFERNFYDTDDIDPDTGSPITKLTGDWAIDGDDGYYYADGGQTEYRAAFGSAAWEDYRVEVDATLLQGRGYGIYYRSDGQANITGYCFQYDPGLASGSNMAFVVRKVVNGSERSPFQRLDLTAAQFPNIEDVSHHTSITVQGSRHIIKVDGQVIFDFNDSDFMTGMPGLRSWDGNQLTHFHNLRVYGIPPLPTNEIVWWSFEEGDGDTVYGSGFRVDNPEINGTLQNLSDISREWNAENIHGQALYADGGNGGYVNFTNSLTFLPTGNFSISAWFKMPNINTNNDYSIISNCHQGNERGWNLSLERIGGNSFGVVFTFREGNNVQLRLLNTQTIEEDKWYHVVATYDGSPYSGSQTIDASAAVIYVTAIDSATVDPSPVLTVLEESLHADSNTIHATSTMKIGAERNGSSRFVGYIDEVKIFSVAIPYAQIQDLFENK